jgi:hypothetical protein
MIATYIPEMSPIGTQIIINENSIAATKGMKYPPELTGSK